MIGHGSSVRNSPISSCRAHASTTEYVTVVMGQMKAPIPTAPIIVKVSSERLEKNVNDSKITFKKDTPFETNKYRPFKLSGNKHSKIEVISKINSLPSDKKKITYTSKYKKENDSI